MKKLLEYLTTFIGVVFVLSMFGAVGAIEADNYFVGFVMAVVGISTGILTIYLQGSKQ